MHFLDCKGMTCPVPVIETKKLIESEHIDRITVAVDNEVSRENVKRFLESRAYEVKTEFADGEWRVSGVRKGEMEEKAGGPGKLLVFVDGETMGRGSDELGRVLMGAFLRTLKDLPMRPWRVIFVNGGVKLAVEGSEVISPLQELAEGGTEILACGTCLDFFHLKEKVRVGRISNMFEILSSLIEASRLIKP